MRALRKNNKAVSDMVSYVLLIVIAMSISAGVYSWLKFYVPNQTDSQACNPDTAIAITDYSCSSSNKLLNLTIENKGYFSVSGFFIRGSNDSTKLPITNLDTIDAQVYVKGRYDVANGFNPGAIINSRFEYSSIGSVKRIQLQPYVTGEKSGLLICPNIVDINLENC